MASSHPSPMVSSDLVWEIARDNNSFMVKRRTGGGVQLSRDPMNLAGVNSRTQAGFVNDKAIGIQANHKGDITMTTKKTKHQHQPAASSVKTTYGSGRSARKIYKGVVGTTAKSGYRPDLRASAVSRVGALRSITRTKKDVPESKQRGAKARKAAADP